MSLRAVFNGREIDAQLAGVCGIYCGACPIYRAWVEQDVPRLESLARSLGVPVARVMCTGCRAPATFCFGGDCEIKRCAQAKGVAFCAQCSEFPCVRIERLSRRAPHCAEVLENVPRIREVGWYEWLREQDAHWRCPACGAKSGFGDDVCCACGRPL